MGARAPFITRILLTLCALALAPGLLPGSNSVLLGTARAQAPKIELISGGDVIGDGAMPVTLHILALNGNGTSMENATFKLTAQGGTTEKVTLVRPGLFQAQWIPPKVSAVTDIVVGIRGKTQDKEPVSKDWSIAVHPPLGQQVQITANPARLTLGQDPGATLSIQLSGGSAQDLANVDLLVRASSGKVSNVTHLGGGKFAASYQPPKKLFPHLEIITVADRRAPNRTFGSTVIPLVGTANFKVVGQPNGTVLIRIDDREFGPAATDARGTAQVPIEVRPGFENATLISVVDGRKTEGPLDLRVPSGRRLALFPIQTTIPADPALRIPIRAYVATSDGGADTAAKVTFQTTAGNMSPAVHEGNGVYRSELTPPFGTKTITATLQVEVDDVTGAQAASTDLKMVPARPGEVQLTAEPPELSKDAAGFQVMAKILASDGVGMPGRSLSFSLDGAVQRGDTIDLGNGDYQARFNTTGKGGVELIATARAVATDNHLHRVLVFPSRDRMPPDGLSSTMLTVLTLDEFGYPVANIPVQLELLHGEGTLPAQTTTDKAGLAQVHFTAGRKAGVARVRATARTHSTTIPILIAPYVFKGLTVAEGYALPVSGNADTIALFEAWRRIIRAQRLDREGMAGAPIAGVIGASAVGPISQITASSDPSSVAAGGTVTILVSATDTGGRGVGGRPIAVTASAGTVGAVTDLGGGKYQAQVTIPAGTAGKATVNVVAPDVQVGTTVEIPISGGGTWRSVATADQTTEPAAAPAAAPTRKPREGPPIIRADIGAVLGGYSYKQESTVAAGPLYDYDITFGAQVTPAASAPGFALGGKVWLPGSLKYLGVEGRYRSVYYSLALPEFSTPIVDWLNEFSVKGLVRYPHDVGDVRMYIGAGIGPTADDFMIYEQQGNEDVRVLEYRALVVPGMVTGPEVGVDWKGTVFAESSLNFGLANGTKYYKISWNTKAGYAFHQDWYAFLGSEITNRETGVWIKPDGGGAKTQVGILADHLNAFSIGIGYQH